MNILIHCGNHARWESDEEYYSDRVREFKELAHRLNRKYRYYQDKDYWKKIYKSIIICAGARIDDPRYKVIAEAMIEWVDK